MKDEFDSFKTTLTSPAREAFAITPDDSTDLSAPSRAIFVGGTGSLSVKMVSGQTVRFESVLPGTVYALRVAQVLATGTTATGLICLR